MARRFLASSQPPPRHSCCHGQTKSPTAIGRSCSYSKSPPPWSHCCLCASRPERVPELLLSNSEPDSASRLSYHSKPVFERSYYSVLPPERLRRRVHKPALVAAVKTAPTGITANLLALHPRPKLSRRGQAASLPLQLATSSIAALNRPRALTARVEPDFPSLSWTGCADPPPAAAPATQ